MTFEAFWDSYPRRVGRKYAEQCYRRAVKKHGAVTILAGLDRWNKARPVCEQQFIPHASTWLNQERYLEKPEVFAEPGERLIAPGPRVVWVGGRGFGAMDMIGIRRKQALRQPLDPDEQAALEAWNRE